MLAGVGTAFLIIPLLTVVVSGVSADMAPSASAFVTLSIQLGGSISSAIVVTILDRRQRMHSDVLAGHATLHAPAVARTFSGRLGELFGTIQNQANVLAYADIAFLVSAVAFVLVPIVAIVRRPPKDRALEASIG